MIVNHWTSEVPERIESVTQGENDFRPKPRGFWVSDDSPDNWETWCYHEEFARETFVHKMVIDLDTKFILQITSGHELDIFTDMYEVKLLDCIVGINWAEVAKAYSGILIMPYLWERRLSDKTPWYYGWDCSSGCIWDSDAIRAWYVEKKKVDVGG